MCWLNWLFITLEIYQLRSPSTLLAAQADSTRRIGVKPNERRMRTQNMSISSIEIHFHRIICYSSMLHHIFYVYTYISLFGARLSGLSTVWWMSIYVDICGEICIQTFANELRTQLVSSLARCCCSFSLRAHCTLASHIHTHSIDSCPIRVEQKIERIMEL